MCVCVCVCVCVSVGAYGRVATGSGSDVGSCQAAGGLRELGARIQQCTAKRGVWLLVRRELGQQRLVCRVCVSLDSRCVSGMFGRM
jgi:hypothetical protein